MSSATRLNRYKLRTEFHEDTVTHTTFESDLATRRRRVEVKTTWKREMELGAGGFGEVWRERGENGKLRAVKILPRVLLNTQKIDYTRELETLVELKDHPDLFIRFFGWFEDKSFIYLAMEYIEHGDLGQYIKNCGPTAKSEAKEITTQILEGLVVLHDRDICHRDLKPQNILIASTSPIWVKITDFGISKRETGSHLRTVCGTECYKAPEQLGLLPREFKVPQFYTKAIDMWALGTLVHEVLTSEIPFLEASTQEISSGLRIDTTLYTTDIPPATDMTLLYNYCHGVNDFPTERLLKHQTSEKGVEFLRNLLAVNPNARPTATEALESLWLIERDEPIEEAANLDLDLRVTGADTLVDPKLIEKSRTNEEATSLNPGTHAILLPTERDSIKKETMSSGDSTQAQVLSQFFQSLINKKHGVPTTHAVKALPPAERGRDIKCGIDCENMRTEFLSLGVQLSPETANRLIIEDKAGTAKLLRSSTRLGIRTIQHSAASNGYLEAMKILLKVTDDIDFRIEGFTPLQSAVNGDRLDMVDLLLKSGADVNAIARSPFELIRTALQVGAKRGNLDMVKLLLDNGAEVDAAPARYGRTALQAAAEEGHLEVVKLLYNNGADINASPAKEGNARTALQAAAAKNRFATVKFLLYNDADVNAGPANGYPTALQLATRYSHRNYDVVRLLLDSGADPNVNSPNIGTPLQAAAEIGNLDLVKLLLERGANINAEPATNRGRTALQAAAGGAHFDLVKLFLERGADINSEPAISGGRTALQAAAERGNLELVELLLENGADVNAGPAIEEGKTALQAATEGKHLDIVNLLLRKGTRNSN